MGAQDTQVASNWGTAANASTEGFWDEAYGHTQNIRAQTGSIFKPPPKA